MPSNNMCKPVVGIENTLIIMIFIISKIAIIIDDKRIKLGNVRRFFCFRILDITKQAREYGNHLSFLVAAGN